MNPFIQLMDLNLNLINNDYIICHKPYDSPSYLHQLNYLLGGAVEVTDRRTLGRTYIEYII